MSEDTSDNITPFPIRPRPASDSPLTVVHSYSGCQHLRVEVDEKLAQVCCCDCRAQLNPIWVLTRMAQEDAILRDRWAGMRAEIRLLGERVKFKCRSCGNWNRIAPRANQHDIWEMVQKIKREESL